MIKHLFLSKTESGHMCDKHEGKKTSIEQNVIHWWRAGVTLNFYSKHTHTDT